MKKVQFIVGRSGSGKTTYCYNAIEKALKFFSENISIIESMSKELLGESQTVTDFAKSKEQRYQEIEALGNQLGISGLITKSGAITKSKKKENVYKY